MTVVMPMAEGILYGLWLDNLYSLAHPDEEFQGYEHRDEATRVWRMAEIARGRDFVAEWREAFRTGAHHTTREAVLRRGGAESAPI